MVHEQMVCGYGNLPAFVRRIDKERSGMKPISIPNWLFYPHCMMAMNIHNGSMFQFFETADGWTGSGINNPPAHVEALGKWFFKWIEGKVE